MNEPTPSTDTPAPSTGEEVSDEAKAAWNTWSTTERGWANYHASRAWIFQSGFSTARAQDKAALAELEHQVKVFTDERERFVQFCRSYDLKPLGVGPIQLAEAHIAALRTEVAGLKTEIAQWRHENDGLRTRGNELLSEVARLTKYSAGLLLAVEGYNGIKAELEKEVARLKAEVEELEQRNDRLAAGAGRDFEQISDLRTRLAQAEKKVHDERLSRTVTWNKVVSEHEASRDLAEQRVRELEAQGTVSYDEVARAVDKAIGLVRTVSSCPAGTDLAAWVAQLAEDKETLESAMRLGMVSISGVDSEGFPHRICYAHRDSLRSAIDAANHKTE